MIAKVCDRKSRQDLWFENRLVYVSFGNYIWFLMPISMNLLTHNNFFIFAFTPKNFLFPPPPHVDAGATTEQNQ